MILHAAFLVFSVGITLAAEILVLQMVPSHSHSFWWHSIANILLERGHQVTILDTDPPRESLHPNLTHFEAKGGYEREAGTYKSLETLVNHHQPMAAIDIFVEFQKACGHLMRSDGTRRLIEQIKRGKRFDLVMSDSECDSFLRFVPLSGNPPLIMATAFGDNQRILRLAGHVDNPSYVPSQFSNFAHPMTLMERAMNLWYSVYETVTWQLGPIKWAENLATEIFGEGPSVNDIAHSATLVFVNRHFVLSGAKPLPAAAIPIPGIHIQDIKPLPKDLKDFLNGANDGAILFSFGGNLQSSDMSAENVEKFRNVFARLKQRVIWKWEKEPLKNITPNIMMQKWLPQNDILGHRNLKAFISHGGLLSTQESVYRGVPLLTIPFMLDQWFNSANIVKRGLGLRIDYKDLDEEKIESSLTTLINNPEYRQRMETASRLFKDRPQTAKETAAYWIEYVLRNRNSLESLRSGSLDLAWYQLIYLDLAVIVLLLVIVLVYLTRVILKALFCKAKSFKAKQN